MKETFSVKLQTENLCFCLWYRLNGYCPNGEYNALFKQIYQNVMGYPRSKSNLHWSVIGKILLHIEESEQSKELAKRFNLFQIQLWVLVGVTTPRKVSNFYPHLSLNTVFSAFKLTQDYYVKMNISFSWKLGS